MSEQLIPTPGVFGENGNFLLERELGTGGMGGVYMGRDKMLDRPVAVKVMTKEYGNDAEFVEKFKKEAQAAAKLIHPNIAQIYSYGICDGMPYIAMELVPGGSLYSIMQNGGGHTDIARVMKICQQVAQALQCASDLGFVHGDVKPENVLLDANGNAKLVDFGLAAMQKDTDEIWGTPYYISPEKVRKEPIDFRADMYSLGGTLYHALTGVAPFEGEDSIAVVKKRFDGPPKKPSEIRPEITPAIDALVMKMLELDRNNRYPSFESLLEAFKEVLTSGLTAKTGSAAAKKPASGTTVRMTSTLRTGRRTIAMRRKPLSAGGVSPDTANSETKAESEDDEEEEGGNLGVKVALFIVGGILLVGAIVGGLIWFKVSAAAAEQRALETQLNTAYSNAKDAIADTVKKANAFADEFEAFAKKATDECEKTTAELSKILPEEHAKLLKPELSKELLDAIASTNAPAPAAAEAAPAAPAPSPAATNAPAAATAPAATNAPSPSAAAPTNAPPKAAAKEPAKTANVKEEKAPEKAPEVQLPAAVVSMHELWNRAYSCQACVIRIRQAQRGVLAKAAEADEIKEPTRENVDKLGAISRAVVDLVEVMKSSKDVEDVRKGISFIKSKGESTVQQTVKRLRIEKLEADRKAKAEAAEAAEKARKEKAAAEKKELVEKEIADVKAKFETIVAQGSFRILDWQTAARQLEMLKAELKTAEAQLAADSELRKVANMKKVHEVLVKSMSGYVFRKGGKPNMKGYKVVSANDKEIQLEKPGKAKGTQKCTWSRFYKEFPNNLNEAVNFFIVDGRKNAKPHLNLREWADAMTGAALTLQIVCSDVTGAVEYGEKLAKDTVKQFPEYLKVAKEMFPDITFDTSSDE